MTHVKNFRSALNGFNREDVVQYIEYLNAKHNAQMLELTAELDLLRSEAPSADFSRQLSQAQEEVNSLRYQLTQKNAALEALQEQLEDLQTAPQPAVLPQANVENQQLQLRCEALEQQLREAREAANVSHCSMEQELELYRRAERTEREARERAVRTEAEANRRAEEINRLATGALADATVRVDEAYIQIGDLTDKVTAQLQQLQLAVTDSRLALSDAASSLATIAPGSDK